MNAKAKQPKKLRHNWVRRPDSGYLNYCTACGVYEDTVELRTETLKSITIRSVKVYRPYKKPGRRFTGRAQPPCVPIENGPADPPPSEENAGDAQED